jgi:hypothetical protein
MSTTGERLTFVRAWSWVIGLAVLGAALLCLGGYASIESVRLRFENIDCVEVIPGACAEGYAETEAVHLASTIALGSGAAFLLTAAGSAAVIALRRRTAR